MSNGHCPVEMVVDAEAERAMVVDAGPATLGIDRATGRSRLFRRVPMSQRHFLVRYPGRDPTSASTKVGERRVHRRTITRRMRKRAIGWRRTTGDSGDAVARAVAEIEDRRV